MKKHVKLFKTKTSVFYIFINLYVSTLKILLNILSTILFFISEHIVLNMFQSLPEDIFLKLTLALPEKLQVCQWGKKNMCFLPGLDRLKKSGLSLG